MGETGVTDEEYGEDADINSKVRGSRVKTWVDALVEQPGLRQSQLCEVKYGEGHICVVIRRGGATNLISLIERMLTRAAEDSFDTMKIVVQITWSIDNFDN